MANNTITWEYAQNFEENEKRWEELKTNLQLIVRVFSKNTILQVKLAHQYFEILEIYAAIAEGDRSEYLYKKAKDNVVDTERLEDVGKQLTNMTLKFKD